MPQSPVLDRLQSRLKQARIINVVLVVLVLFLAIVLIAQSVNTANNEVHATDGEQQQTTGEQSNPSPAQASTFERRDEQDPLAIGDVDAPIVLVNYTDPRCPFCAKFANDVQPELVKQYVDTGQLRIEFRVVAAFGPDSEATSQAIFAAGHQGKGVEYLAELYDRHPGQGQPVHDQDELVAIAEAVNVTDIEQFVTDLESEDMQAQVARETTEWQQLGITSVPFFLIDDEGFAGARELAVFQDFIDANLAEH